MSDRRAVPVTGALVLALSGELDRAEIPRLCERLAALLRDGSPTTGDVVCDVAELAIADAVVVEALARLQLTARRSGWRLHLRHASAELQALLALMGLSEVLPLEEAVGSGEPRRQAEEREEPRRVQEEGDAADAPVP